MAICLCCLILDNGMCIPHWLHCRSGVGLSCRIAIFYFQYLYIKCFLSLPGLYALDRHPSTGHATYFKTRVKYSIYFSGPPPPRSTPRVCVMIIPWYLYMWWRSGGAAIVAPYSSQLTIVLFRSLNVPPSPISLRLYAASPWCPHMNPLVQTTAFIFSIFFCNPNILNIRTTAISAVCTKLRLQTNMQLFYAYKTMLWSPASHTSPCCDSCGYHTSSSTALATISTTMLKFRTLSSRQSATSLIPWLWDNTRVKPVGPSKCKLCHW